MLRKRFRIEFIAVSGKRILPWLGRPSDRTLHQLQSWQGARREKEMPLPLAVDVDVSGLAGDHARIRKARRPSGESIRGRLALDGLRGSADVRMSTNEILALTRGKSRATTRRK